MSKSVVITGMTQQQGGAIEVGYNFGDTPVAPVWNGSQIFSSLEDLEAQLMTLGENEQSMVKMALTVYRRLDPNYLDFTLAEGVEFTV